MLSLLLLLLVGVLVARLMAGRLRAWAVPVIVLELVLGFALGNSVLPFERIAPLSGLTELGVLTLFFQVGLEVRGDLLASGRSTVLRTVAISALAPVLAFWPLRQWFGMTLPATLLSLAVLSATGTGVTLRVLAQRSALASPSGRLLVGVSVLDDLPAIVLLSLAVAAGGRATNLGASWSGLAALPLGLLLGVLSLRAVDLWRRHRAERPRDPLAILLLLITSAWVGEFLGLTSLLGALWGGVLLARLEPAGEEVRRMLAVLSEVFLPLYFLSVGMRVEARSLLQPQAWSLALVLTVLAVLCKLACGLAVGSADRKAGIDRWVVVFGLMPRGLPGLVFASTALATGVITASQFSALVLMVAVTTVVGLLLLERRLRKHSADQAGLESTARYGSSNVP